MIAFLTTLIGKVKATINVKLKIFLLLPVPALNRIAHN